jgi:hypothetical protein
MPDMLLAADALHAMGINLSCGDYTASYKVAGESYQLPLLWAAEEEELHDHHSGNAALLMMAWTTEEGDTGREVWRATEDPLAEPRIAVAAGIHTMCLKTLELIRWARIFPMPDNMFRVKGKTVDRLGFAAGLTCNHTDCLRAEAHLLNEDWHKDWHYDDERMNWVSTQVFNRANYGRLYQPAEGPASANEYDALCWAKRGFLTAESQSSLDHPDEDVLRAKQALRRTIADLHVANDYWTIF